ncbi:hypothetical protein [Arenicella xantha]|uniref:Uncharacterized protein n=1 Tax=Arenicella xantha TaxID=644221 RepID=A0A395JEN3_9GAMM|nr:hypothetical protein [Arenicella xantha]RBP46992.1 hypothetical protein DFR28_1163 [Arenicella xantha]
MRQATVSIFLLVSNCAVHAGLLEEDFQRHYDLVAIVAVDSESQEYQDAYNVTVESVVYRYGEDIDAVDNYQPTNIVAGDQVVLVRYGIRKLKKVEEAEDNKRKTKRVESIRQDGCNLSKKFSVGKRLRLFSVEVEPGFYKNNACRLTTTLDENT